MAYTVGQQTPEIGIRLLLGADSCGVTRMVARQGMSMALIGISAGLVAAWGVSQLIEKLLLGVKAHDPIVFVSCR